LLFVYQPLKAKPALVGAVGSVTGWP